MALTLRVSRTGEGPTYNVTSDVIVAVHGGYVAVQARVPRSGRVMSLPPGGGVSMHCAVYVVDLVSSSICRPSKDSASEDAFNEAGHVAPSHLSFREGAVSELITAIWILRVP